LPRDDQAHLALVLRQLLLGDRVALVLTCPACGEGADVDLSIPELLPDGADVALTVRVETDAGPVVVRDPTGVDDAAVEGLDDAVAAPLLWSRLVIDVDGHGPVDLDGWHGLGRRVHQQVALGLADHQVGPDLHFLSPCPHCGATVAFALDAPALLAREVGAAELRLLAEVHVLAFHYHWSEDTILDLPRDRRWQYLELVGRQLAGRPLIGSGP
jgi:hypothetical protein